MKKITILFLLLSEIVFANAISSEKQLMDEILSGIYPNKKVFKVYFYGDNIPKYIKNNPRIKLINNKNKSDLIIINKIGFNESIKKPEFVLGKYSFLKEYKYSIGAYFLEKSRENLLFIFSRLKKFNLKIPKKFEPYTEEKIW